MGLCVERVPSICYNESQVKKDGTNEMKKAIGLFNLLLEKYGIYLFALAVLVLNYSLAFDNVVWGDEAFSGNVIRDTNAYGLLQRVYYWDAHPPLYYFWIRLLCNLFGYETCVLHFGALIPFTVSIVIGVFVFGKLFGKIPAAFFVLVLGFSETCVEYNLEIRMYALLFLEILLCLYFGWRILDKGDSKRHWVAFVLFGLSAAYTHYYGLVVSGLTLFFTGVAFYWKNKKKAWIPGVISVGSFIVLYIPWLPVLYKHMSSSGNWWRTDINPVNMLLTLMFGGENMKPILMPIAIVMSVVVLLVESKVLYFSLPTGTNTLQWNFRRPSTKTWSTAAYMLSALWAVILCTYGFTYAVSYLKSPLTTPRYMYSLIPAVLVILMICIHKLLLYGNILWGMTIPKDCEVPAECRDSEEKAEDRILLIDREKPLWRAGIFVLVSCVFMLLLGIGLMDFKYFRSVTKTQNVETAKILQIIGEPDEDTVFTAIEVQHLSWTVLEYYYPDHEVYDKYPHLLEVDAKEIWAFMGRQLYDFEVEILKEKGYSVELYPDMWMGKYGCQLYHFYK